MRRMFLIAASLLAISSAGAMADTEHLHATLASPAKTKSFLTGSVAWHCDGTACVTASPLQENGPKGLCRALVRTAGQVTEFEGLDASQLQACNGAKS